VLCVVALVVGFSFGVLYGKKIGIQAGKVAGRAESKAILELVYPPAPDELHSLSGEIVDIFGSIIRLRAPDPADHLPTVDGSPKDTIEVSAVTRRGTEFVLIDYTERDSLGNPVETAFSLTDLVKGDLITVRSEENVRGERRFDVDRVEKVRY
jgi:hypothetical protein